MNIVVAIVARFASASGLPEDVCENVWHFGSEETGFTAGELDGMMDAVETFYTTTTPTGGTNGPGEYLSASLDHGANKAQLLAYATIVLDGSQPLGSPVGSRNFTLPNPLSASMLPEEVAAVMSFNGDLTDVPVSETNPSPPPATIRPAQRRRGRIFLGPLNASAGGVQGSFLRPAGVLRTDLGKAAIDLAGTVAGGGTFVWGVWSKADAEVWEVIGGYVDDAWDTQRRRGLAPTVRTAFVIP